MASSLGKQTISQDRPCSYCRGLKTLTAAGQNLARMNLCKHVLVVEGKAKCSGGARSAGVHHIPSMERRGGTRHYLGAGQELQGFNAFQAKGFHPRYLWDAQVSCRALLAAVVDINGASPRRYFFEVLKSFAENGLEAERLEHFSTPEGREDLYRYNQSEGRP